MTQPPHPPAPPPPPGPPGPPGPFGQPGQFGQPGVPGYDPRFPASPAYVAPPPAAFNRPFGVLLLAILNGFGALLYGAAGFLLILGAALSDESREDAGAVLGVVGALIVIVGAVHLATAIGLFLLKGFGRVLQLIQSAIGLIAIPIGTIISAVILYYLTRPGVALLFSGRAPAAMTPEERQIVDRDANKGGMLIVVTVLLALLAVPMLGIVAAIAIPGLLRARMAGNEAAAIGRLRAMSSAQAMYSSTHDGRHGTLACLTVPSSCNDPATAPYFPHDGDGPRSGYRFTLHLPEDGSRFTFFAEPDNPGVSGRRAFCVDQTHVVLQYLDGQTVIAPAGADAPCPDGGQPVM